MGGTMSSYIEQLMDVNEWRRHGVCALGEFIGTISFLWLAFAGQSFAARPSSSAAGNGNVENAANVLYVALMYAFSYTINIWIFFPMNGGFFNPAITLSLVLIQEMAFVKGLLLFMVQFIGSIVAAYLVLAMFPFALRANTIIIPQANLAQGVFIEAFLTTLLILTVFVFTVEKTRAAMLAPLGIGLALFTAELTGLYYTGASLNPARSLGPAVATEIFGKYHWIYYVGPFIGSGLAAATYMLMRSLGYRGMLEDHEAGYNPDRQPYQPQQQRPPSGERPRSAERPKRALSGGASASFV